MIARRARAGSGQWLFPGGEGPVAGQAGRLLRYRVVVEADLGPDLV